MTDRLKEPRIQAAVPVVAIVLLCILTGEWLAALMFMTGFSAALHQGDRKP